MVQLERVKTERDAQKGRQEAPQKALSAAVEVVHDTIEGLSRQQHELTGQHSEIAGLLSGTA